MNPTQLSYELRRRKTPDLTRRRWIVGLNLLGVSMGQLVSAYQTGLVPRLPDPPGKLGEVFDATKVDASDYAYKRYRSPDGVAMITTYAVTTWLAGAGGEDRADEDAPFAHRDGREAPLRRGHDFTARPRGVGGKRGVLPVLPGGDARLTRSAALAAPEVWRAGEGVARGS